MIKTLSVMQIVAILETGNFDEIINTIEDEQVEVKGSPYRLSHDAQKQELAKDVSALGNAAGGIILIGFETEKDSLNAVERVIASRPFAPALVDLGQYESVLQAWVCPAIETARVRWYPSINDPTKGIVAIIVPPEAVEGKPYVVRRFVAADGRVRGSLIGYFERFRDHIPETPAERLRTLLRDGMRYEELLSQRFAQLESMIKNLPHNAVPGSNSQSAAPQRPGLSDEEIEKRINDAMHAVERSSEPIIVLVAASENYAEFRGLFDSDDEEVVKLLDHPPMRSQGFAIGNALSRPSENVQGRLRRRTARGHQLIDIWLDGLVVAIGQGDYDLLCWWTRYPGDKDLQNKSLIIRNFVLAEVTLYFLDLAIKTFQNAEPTSLQLKFLLMLDNMTVNGHLPCELSPVPDNSSTPVESGSYKTASQSTISSKFSTRFDGIDMAKVAYELLGGIYTKFGFNRTQMPYIEDDGGVKRITFESIMPKKLS